LAARQAAALLLASVLVAPARAQAPGPAGPATAAPSAAAAKPPPDGSPTPGGKPPRRSGTVLDELLLRPRRATEEGRGEYARGSHPQALSAFERAAGARPQDPAVRFNVADGLYKNGKYDEAAAVFRALGADPLSPVAGASRHNLGNSLYQKQDYRGAIQAYRDALRVAPGAEDTRRNLELALRALKEQEEQQKRQPQDQDKDQKKDQQQKPQPDQKGQDQRQQPQPQQKQQGPPRPQTPQERADQRFKQEAGMPQERAMQLLDALQQNEKAEQKKLLALKRGQKKKGKDW
jgi:tetratricopeptide (TPR) repeat protein